MLTDEQIKARKTGIGGSDAAAVCGLSKYKTPYQLFLEKTTEYASDASNDFTYWGNILEETVANEYAKRTDKKLEVIENTITSEKYPFMIANIDRFIPEENAILECKTCSSMAKYNFGESGTDQIPTNYLLQCAHYAIVLDCAYVDLAVLIDSHDFRIYRYNRNEKLESQLIEKERNFWENHVLKNIAPDPINNDDASKMWIKSTDKEVYANDLIKSEVHKIIEIKQKIKKLEEIKEESELYIKKYLREDKYLVDEFGAKIVSWPDFEYKRLDTNLLKNNFPDVYEKCIRTTTQRRLMVHG